MCLALEPAFLVKYVINKTFTVKKQHSLIRKTKKTDATGCKKQDKDTKKDIRIVRGSEHHVGYTCATNRIQVPLGHIIDPLVTRGT